MPESRINIGNISIGDDSINIGRLTTRNTGSANNARAPFLKGEKGDKGDKRR